jgi:hypothetical protein
MILMWSTIYKQELIISDFQPSSINYYTDPTNMNISFTNLF